jgi:predicted nucleic acid-binding protein
MIVLDPYSVIAYLRGEAAVPEVRPPVDANDTVLTAVGVAEVLDHLIRFVGVDEEDATLDLAQLGLIDGIVVDSSIGASAGRLRARPYDRTCCTVSTADCIAAEVARSRTEALATSDPHLLDLCHAEGIGTVVLPGSDGSRWAQRVNVGRTATRATRPSIRTGRRASLTDRGRLSSSGTCQGSR